MANSNKDHYTRISVKISKKLLDEFDDYARSRNYQRRDKAIIDMIEKELSGNR